MKQDRRSTKLSDDDVETLDIPDGVELEEIKADDDESRTDDSSTHLAARLLGMPQRLSTIIIEPVSENEGFCSFPLRRCRRTQTEYTSAPVTTRAAARLQLPLQ